MIFFKKCKRCGRIFDIGINMDYCPECRVLILKEVREKWEERKKRLKMEI